MTRFAVPFAVACLLCAFTGISFSKPQAILFNGGIGATNNYCRYYENLERGHSVFKDWERTTLSADGHPKDGPANMVKCTKDDQIVYDETTGRPVLVTKETDYKVDAKADFDELKKIVEGMISNVEAGEPIVLYFTDHGGRKYDRGMKSFVSSWQDKGILPDKYRKQILRYINTRTKDMDPKPNIISMYDTCFSGGMLEASFESDDKIVDNSCGFSVSGPEEWSWHAGGIMKTMDHLSKKTKKGKTIRGKFKKYDLDNDKKLSFAEAFRYMKLQDDIDVLSSPMSTSDLFIDKYISANALDEGDKTKKASEITDSCKIKDDNYDDIRTRFGTIAAPLLKKKLKEIEKDLETHLKGLKDKEGFKDWKTVTLADVTKKVTEGEKKSREYWDALSEARDVFRSAMTQWMDKVKPPEVVAFDEKRNALKKLRDEKADKDKIEKALKEYTDAKLEYEALVDSIVENKNKNFNKWIRGDEWAEEEKLILSIVTDSKRVKYGDNIMDQLSNLKDKFGNANQDLIGLKKAYGSFKTYHGIKHMIAKSDSTALGNYLKLLQCEETIAFPQ